MPKSYQLGDDMVGVSSESTNTVTQCVERFESIILSSCALHLAIILLSILRIWNVK